MNTRQCNGCDEWKDAENDFGTNNAITYGEYPGKNYLCRTCIAERKRKSREINGNDVDKKYKQDHPIQHKLYGLKAKDEKAGREFDIDVEYVLQIAREQNEINLYTYTPIYWKVEIDGDDNSGDPFSSSIDRIDSNIGHIRGNIQIVESWINRFKLNFDDEFPMLLNYIKFSKTLTDTSRWLFVQFPENLMDKVSYPNGEVPKTANDFKRFEGDVNTHELKRKIQVTTNNIINNTKSSQLEKFGTPKKDFKKICFNRKYFYELLAQQGYRCAITGIFMNLQSENPYKVSIDRIDSKLPYTKDNIHLVCHAVNSAKNKMDYYDFLERMCMLQIGLLEADENISSLKNPAGINQ